MWAQWVKQPAVKAEAEPRYERRDSVYTDSSVSLQANPACAFGVEATPVVSLKDIMAAQEQASAKADAAQLNKSKGTRGSKQQPTAKAAAKAKTKKPVTKRVRCVIAKREGDGC